MTIDETITIILGLLALACYLALIYRRVHDDREGSRYLFVDVVLAVSALEVVADTIGFHALALLCQGMVMAGGVALLATYRKD